MAAVVRSEWRAALLGIALSIAACSPSSTPSAPATVSEIATRSGPSPTIQGTAAPSATDSLASLPSPGGTCTADQIVAGRVAKYGPGYGSPSLYVTQPLRNAG